MVRDKWLNRGLPVKEEIPLSFELPGSGINLRTGLDRSYRKIRDTKKEVMNGAKILNR